MIVIMFVCDDLFFSLLSQTVKLWIQVYSHDFIICLYILAGCLFNEYFSPVQVGCSALMNAVKKNSSDIVELLLKAEANSNVKNNVSVHLVNIWGRFILLNNNHFFSFSILSFALLK